MPTDKENKKERTCAKEIVKIITGGVIAVTAIIVTGELAIILIITIAVVKPFTDILMQSIRD